MAVLIMQYCTITLYFQRDIVSHNVNVMPGLIESSIDHNKVTHFTNTNTGQTQDKLRTNTGQTQDKHRAKQDAIVNGCLIWSMK